MTHSSFLFLAYASLGDYLDLYDPVAEEILNTVSCGNYGDCESSAIFGKLGIVHGMVRK